MVFDMKARLYYDYEMNVMSVIKGVDLFVDDIRRTISASYIINASCDKVVIFRLAKSRLHEPTADVCRKLYPDFADNIIECGFDAMLDEKSSFKWMLKYGF